MHHGRAAAEFEAAAGYPQDFSFTFFSSCFPGLCCYLSSFLPLFLTSSLNFPFVFDAGGFLVELLFSDG